MMAEFLFNVCQLLNTHWGMFRQYYKQSLIKIKFITYIEYISDIFVFVVMLKQITILAMILLISQADIRADIVSKVPGYGDHFQPNVYSGYLNTTDESRKLHYIFIQSEKGANSSDPITLWLNGGPGCSSMLGFLQQIGPFYMEDGVNYTDGDPLTQNPYSWHKVSHLLFIQAPAGVGYSINDDPKFQYNDSSTKNDLFAAVKYFFTYFPEYRKNQFWLSGESYAGKYIPDLASEINYYNSRSDTKPEQKINLDGVFIGNGVIDFRDDSLEKSQIQYAIDHGFVDPQIKQYWEISCQQDPESAGCAYFLTKFAQNVEQINPYNVYGYCFYNDSFAQKNNNKQKQFLSQQSILLSLSKNKKFGTGKNFNGAPCAYFDGLYQYFNIHAETFHSKAKKWDGPCSVDISEKYQISQQGSTTTLRNLISREIQGFIIVLYNGDWDSVVPYVDTIKNLEKLDLQESYLYTPIFSNGQHIGFSQIFSGVNFILVKGASHQVPQSRREAALHIFQSLVGHDSMFVPTSHGKPKKKIQGFQDQNQMFYSL